MNQFIDQYKTKTGKLMLVWILSSLSITGFTYFIIYNIPLVIGEVICSIIAFFYITGNDNKLQRLSK